jgi:protein-S-isoprenylcysteine O-methyltransferase Ste14
MNRVLKWFIVLTVPMWIGLILMILTWGQWKITSIDDIILFLLSPYAMLFFPAIPIFTLIGIGWFAALIAMILSEINRLEKKLEKKLKDC